MVTPQRLILGESELQNLEKEREDLEKMLLAEPQNASQKLQVRDLAISRQLLAHSSQQQQLLVSHTTGQKNMLQSLKKVMSSINDLQNIEMTKKLEEKDQTNAALKRSIKMYQYIALAFLIDLILLHNRTRFFNHKRSLLLGTVYQIISIITGLVTA